MGTLVSVQKRHQRAHLVNDLGLDQVGLRAHAVELVQHVRQLGLERARVALQVRHVLLQRRVAGRRHVAHLARISLEASLAGQNT
jgi:hypothetical protein